MDVLCWIGLFAIFVMGLSSNICWIASIINREGPTAAFSGLAVLGSLFVSWPSLANYSLPRGTIERDGGFSPRSCVAIDGDTIHCRLSRSIRTYRIPGIDAPELSRACEHDRAVISKNALAGLLKGRIYIRELKHVTKADPDIRQPVLDKYGRRLADIYVGGRSVADVMIAKGYARPYSGGKRVPLC